jgi:hypothetical protein
MALSCIIITNIISCKRVFYLTSPQQMVVKGVTYGFGRSDCAAW